MRSPAERDLFFDRRAGGRGSRFGDGLAVDPDDGAVPGGYGEAIRRGLGGEKISFISDGQRSGAADPGPKVGRAEADHRGAGLKDGRRFDRRAGVVSRVQSMGGKQGLPARREKPGRREDDEKRDGRLSKESRAPAESVPGPER